MSQKFLKQLPVLLIFVLLGGCAAWTGIPSSYASKEKYPIVASVHGIREITFPNASNSVFISYIPTNQITLNTNTVHGWLIQIPPAEKRIDVKEYFVLPKAARWPRRQLISSDRTTCVTHFTASKGVKYISNDWGMYSTDPLGDYQIAVFLDGKPAADFKFRVIGK